MSLDLEVNTFRHIDRVFPSATVKAGGPVFPLAMAQRQLTDVTWSEAGPTIHLADYLHGNRVAGVLVLKDGRIALERYDLGMDAQTRWVSFSVVKSITSSLAAAALRDGYIASIDDRVARYIPELKSSAYDGVSIRNILQMASGVRWTEGYTDPTSDRRHMLQLEVQQQTGFGGSGFSATLRDYARFGQFVLQKRGWAGGQPVVPEGWFPDAGQPKAVGSSLVPYGYMWWPESGGAFRAYGIFGQSIYVNPKARLVVVVCSAEPKPTGSAIFSDSAFFEAVVEALP